MTRLERRHAGGRAEWLLACWLSASLLGAGCAPALHPAYRPLGEPTPGSTTALDRETRAWVGKTLRGLTVREKAAQLIAVRVPAGFPYGGVDEAAALGRLVDAGVGGLVVSGALSPIVAIRLNELQARARLPLLVASELDSAEPDARLAEAGAPVAQLATADTVAGLFAALRLLPVPLEPPAAADLPPALALGAIGEERFAREAGRIVGARARAAGVHMAFAPPLHVNGDPGSRLDPRSFGEEPAQVARLAVAFLNGLQASGLLSAARPDPWHLLPFRQAVRAGLDAALTNPVSRAELAFEGLMYADAGQEAALGAVEAGADVLLAPEDPEATIQALVDAVRTGRLSERRLDESVRRLLEAKARAGLDRGRRVDPGAATDVSSTLSSDPVSNPAGTHEQAAFAAEAARRALVVPRDVEARIPLDPSTVGAVFSLTFVDGPDPTAGLAFEAALATSGLALRSGRAGPETPPSGWEALAAGAAEVDLVLVSLHARHGHGDAGAAEAYQPLVRFLERTRDEGVPALLLVFGTPRVLSRLPETAGTLIAWGRNELWQRAAADALLGRGDVAGRLPISLPPIHRRGDGLRRPLAGLPRMARGAEVPARGAGMSEEALARVDRILQAAVADSITPGAALAVGRRGALVRLRGYGRTDWASGAPQVTDSTLYDLASITKAVGTATAILLLAEEGRLSLDDTASRWLPEWRDGPLARVTVRDLLLHRSGLPPSVAFWRQHRGKEAYRRVLARVPLLHEPGERTLYSDLGYLALGFVAEEASGQALDRLLGERLFGPLGLHDTGFRPAETDKPRIAPTELDTVYRGFHVHGEVHDENAHAVGGVAGHAGLFSSARDLSRFASLLLDARRQLLSGESVRLLSEPPDPRGARTHGWEAATAGSSGGRHLSYRAFGHTGFTGTSLWIDPEFDLFIVLLTNRVNPTRARDGTGALRRAVHEAVVRAIQDERL